MATMKRDSMTPTARWTMATVGDVLRGVESGKSEQTLERQPNDDDVGVVKVSAVTWGEFDPTAAKAVSPDRFDPARSIKRGDLLFSRANTVELAGAVVHVQEDHPRLMLSDKILRLLVDPEIAPRYLMFALRTVRSRRHLEGSATGTSTSMRNITQENLRATPLPLPPSGEQHRIVARLDAVFAQTRAAKSRLKRLPSLLERLKRSILAAAFRGDLTKQWRAAHPNVEPATLLLERLRAERRGRWEDALRARGKDPKKATYETAARVDAENLSDLPLGWCWASVGEVSELQLGQQRAPIHAAAEVTHPYVRAANIKWGGLDLSDVKRMGFPDPERYRLRDGDVLLSEASGSPTEVGKPAIWRGEIPDCCYQKTLLRARPLSREVSSEWLHAAFLADALLGRFARMAPGVGILHLTAERMLSWPIPMAPADEQREIVERLNRALAAVEKLDAVATKAMAGAARCEESVLAKAFRGELVPHDPDDEPAAVLLERIRAVCSAEPEQRRGGRVARAAAVPTANRPKPAPRNGHASAAQNVDLVVAAFQQDARLTAAAIVEATGLDDPAVKLALADLVDGGLVRVEGKARGTSYVWTA